MTELSEDIRAVVERASDLAIEISRGRIDPSIFGLAETGDSDDELSVQKVVERARTALEAD